MSKRSPPVPSIQYLVPRNARFYWALSTRYWVLNLRPRQLRSMLEVILKNLRGQGGRHFLAVRLDRAHDFSLADDFGGRKSGNLRRQHQIDFQDHIRLQEIFRLK